MLFSFFQHLLIALGLFLGIILPPSPAQVATTPPPPVHVVTPEPSTPSTPTPKPIPPKPKAPSALAPGSPEYEKSLQDALNALATLVTSPSGSLNDLVRAATVNIICTTVVSGPFNSISGSGVIVDPRGVILTNAHVAQYFLLKDYPSPNFVDCTIRTGSPARATYKATLLFIPHDWIADNAVKITQSAPTGSGEHDYALLLITGPAGPSITVPTPFPYVPLNTGDASLGDMVLIAGYPAGFLGGITIAKDLYAASANAAVSSLYTFATSTIDLFSIGGTVVSQHGSSGGPVARANPSSPTGNSLLGIIVTATDAPETADRDLRALASSYIIRDFPAEAGVSLAAFLGTNLPAEAALFNHDIAPSLTTMLTNVLNH